MLTAGQRFGPYEIIAALGAGGMGQVYRARDTTLNRHVAIKAVHDSVALNDDRIARFRREAQALGVLREVGVHHLECHLAREPLVARAVDLAHAALAEQPEHLVRSDARPGCEDR